MQLSTPRTPKLSPRSDWDPRFDRDRPEFCAVETAADCFRGNTTWPPPECWNDALGTLFRARSVGGAPLRFVLQAAKPRRRQGVPVDLAGIYDERIYTAGEIPSRAGNWHDFFNMLVWASFPRAKCALNARQRSALRAHIEPGSTRVPSARTREQDALSMLDEGGVLLVCNPDSSVECTRARAACDVAALAGLAARGTMRALLFGHALMEHRLASDAPVRGAAVVLVSPGEIPRETSRVVALADGLLETLLCDRARFVAPAPERALEITPEIFDIPQGV